MDDCWERKQPPRDPSTGRLVADPTRFPNGMQALGDYYHAKNLSFAAYTAESSTTCGGYPASKDHEELDAKTFAEWGVDYMKVDGCGSKDYYAHGYKAMGAALLASGRDIVYSCSWPAYVGSDETVKPFQTYIDDGCNLWRNWDDIQCSWKSLGSIIDHWGEYGKTLQKWAGPGGPYGGHWRASRPRPRLPPSPPPRTVLALPCCTPCLCRPACMRTHASTGRDSLAHRRHGHAAHRGARRLWLALCDSR